MLQPLINSKYPLLHDKILNDVKDIPDNLASQYVPNFYEKLYGKTNTINVSAEFMDKILQDIMEYRFNNWDRIELLETEFKASEVILSGYKIRQPEFLKSFFRFKGTNTDLEYIMKNMGYESVVYNDGGILHQNTKDSPATVIPTQDFIGDPPKCEVIIKVQIDLNADDYKGYTSTDLGAIKKIVDNRMSVCSFLSKVIVSLAAKDSIDFKNLYDILTIQSIMPPFYDYIFEEYFLDPIKYGKRYNKNLKYGNYNLFQTPIYGRFNQRHFRPMSDMLDFKRTQKITLEEAVSQVIDFFTDYFVLPEKFTDQLKDLPKDEADFFLNLACSDQFKHQILDSVRTDPEFIQDKALDLRVVARKYIKNNSLKYGDKTETGAKIQYGKKEVLQSPSVEMVISLNGDPLQSNPNISDSVDIYIKRDGGKVKL